jgi:uncharacterized membrane protein
MIDMPTLLAILGMAIATYATRLSGFVLLSGFSPRGRLKAALDALPPAILMAVIAPTVFITGPAETIAAGVTAIAAYKRVPLAATIVVGVVSVVVLRIVIN